MCSRDAAQILLRCLHFSGKLLLRTCFLHFHFGVFDQPCVKLHICCPRLRLDIHKTPFRLQGPSACAKRGLQTVQSHRINIQIFVNRHHVNHKSCCVDTWRLANFGTPGSFDNYLVAADFQGSVSVDVINLANVNRFIIISLVTNLPSTSSPASNYSSSSASSSSLDHDGILLVLARSSCMSLHRRLHPESESMQVIVHPSMILARRRSISSCAGQALHADDVGFHGAFVPVPSGPRPFGTPESCNVQYFDYSAAPTAYANSTQSQTGIGRQ
jgi:hypothetical protein